MVYTSRIVCSSVLLFLLIGCEKSDEASPCASYPVIHNENICLSVEHDKLTEEEVEMLEASTLAAVIRIDRVLSIDDLVIRFVENAQLVIPEIGIGGFNPNESEVIIALDVKVNDLETTLVAELLPMLAHEIHHAMRRRIVGYGSTLLQAAVSEGLADHFSIEITGMNPPLWSRAIAGADLNQWIRTASTDWNDRSYSHDAWFRGTDPNIPRWAGYSIGFKLVQDYLLNNPQRLPSNLVGEPASSFEP